MAARTRKHGCEDAGMQECSPFPHSTAQHPFKNAVDSSGGAPRCKTQANVCGHRGHEANAHPSQTVPAGPYF